MGIVKFKKKDIVLNLMLARQVVTDKKVINLFTPLSVKCTNQGIIGNSNIFGGEHIGG